LESKVSRRLLIVTFDPPSGSGGVEGRSMAYTGRLLTRGFHVEVAAISPKGARSREPYIGTRLSRFPSSPIQGPRTLGGIVKMLNDSHLDSVFVLTGGATIIGLFLLAYAKVSRRRSVVFFYGRDLLQAKQRLATRFSVILSLMLAHRVATNSRFTAGLLPLVPRRPIAIVYPGVDPDVRKGLGTRSEVNDSPRVLFVGRLVRRKGADLLLEAFAPLLSSFPSLKLDIVGDGPEMSALRNQASKLGIDKAVDFHGALYGQNLWRQYARASFLVMPSRSSRDDIEGFGTVFLEAGVFGVPSVGTRTGGIPEAVIDGVTGRLVNADDVEGLTKVLFELLSNPVERQRLGEGAKERAQAFNWDASCQNVIRLFE
jgi:phosphatidylinositol alpha-1,6-mannosyltransferase